MRKRSHPLHIYRRVKELRLLHPLFVSARHSFPSTHLAPSLSHLLPPYIQRLALYLCHATSLPAGTLTPTDRLPLLHSPHHTATKASLTSLTSLFLLLTMLALRSSRCQRVGRVGELKHLLLLSIPAYGVYPSNSPTPPFRPACKPSPQAYLSFPDSLAGATKEAYFIFLFYRAVRHRARRGIYSSKYKGEGGGRLPSPFVVRSCAHGV